jgi:putative DNA primase/helicase
MLSRSKQLDKDGKGAGERKPHTKAEIESAPERPQALAVEPDGIPAELKERDQWVCWRFERRDGKWTKLPIDPKNGRGASSTAPTTWGPFEKALAYYERHQGDGKADGIGFVFAEDDPFAGVDLDDTRNATTGGFDHQATELSPSGTGVKVFLRGKIPPGGNRKGNVEMYDRGRYFAVTGHRIEEFPATVEERQQALDALHARLFPPPTERAPRASPTVETPTLTDQEIIAKAKAAKNGTKFKRLWSGVISDYPSASEAVSALCWILAYWTREAAQIDRLFRLSGLHQGEWVAKWERLGKDQIAKALAGVKEFYHPSEEVETEEGGEGAKEVQAQQLVRLAMANGTELFHDPDRTAYATIKVQGHSETHKIRSRDFSLWLRKLFRDANDKPPSAQAVTDALNSLEADALFDGKQHRVWVRLAEHDGRVYLDLCDGAWQVVEIDANGWRLAREVPVKFRRAKAMLPLPLPVEGGSLAELRPFVNVGSEEDWQLILGWLVASTRPSGPFPALL